MTKPEFVSVPRHLVGKCEEMARSLGAGRIASELETLLAAAPSPEPRAVEGKCDACDGTGIGDAYFGESCPHCEDDDEPTPQSAPAPLTERDMVCLHEAIEAARERGWAAMAFSLQRIADYHRDREGKKS